MARFIRTHPLVTYYLLTFGLSWGGFVIAVGPRSLVSSNWQAEGKFLAAVMTMLAGPSIAGLLLTGLLEGRTGYRELLTRLLAWRVGAGWYLVAILPPTLISAGVLFLLSLDAPLFTADNKMAVLFGGLGAGVTTILEEIGWTGFVVPRLLRSRSVPATGLIVGVLWGIWHFLQQVFISGTYAGGIPIGVFLALSFLAAVANLTAFRVLLVWVYAHTASLFVTTLMHAMLTAASIFWFTAATTGWTFLTSVWITAAMTWLLVGAVAFGEGWIGLPLTVRAAAGNSARFGKNPDR